MKPQPAIATGADPAAEISIRHLWVAAGHSLCELETGDGDDELSEALDVHAAMCGPCLLVVGRLRRQACAFLDLSGGQAVPPSIREGWRLLKKTPWQSRLDLDTFLRDNPDLDQQSRYDAIRYEVDPGTVNALVDEIWDLRAALHEQ